MAMADAEGFVRSTAPGIARRANLGLTDTEAALEIFESPDSHSRTLDEEGKRIKRIDGGYQIVNYEKYRERDYTAAERQKRWREKQKSNAVTTVTNNVISRRVTHAEAEAEAEAKTKKKPPNPLKGECDGFDLFWSEYPNKQAKLAAKRAWLKIKTDERVEVMSGIARWKRSESWLKDDGQFIPHPATFLNQRRFEDSPKSKALKKKIYYNHLPPKNDMPDSDFVSVRDVARREMEKLREKLKT